MPSVRSAVRKKMERPGAQVASLQARKQRLARVDIGARAMGLFLERGFDKVTADDLAREAGISRRTFFRYFATKEDVVTSAVEDFGLALLEEFRRRPRQEPPLASLRVAIGTAIQQFAIDPGQSQALLRLIRKTPALRSQFLLKQDDWADRLATAVSERLPESACSLVLARLTARVAMATADAAITSWTEGCPEELPAVIDRAFEALDALVETALATGRGHSGRGRRRREQASGAVAGRGRGSRNPQQARASG